MINKLNYKIEDFDLITLDNYSLLFFKSKIITEKPAVFLTVEDELGAYSFKDLIAKFNDEGHDVFVAENQDYRSCDAISKYFKKELNDKDIIVISFGKSDKLANIVATYLSKKVYRRIIISPKEVRKNFSYPTLIMWSDLDKKYRNDKAATSLFIKNKTNHYVKFIAYPNYSHAIHLGRSGSHYFDEAKNSLPECEIKRHLLSSLDKEFLEDLTLFIDKGEVKEKIAIVSENHLPFLNGVNVLTDLLKKELEKMGTKVYVITLKLKEHNYIEAPDNNIKTFKGILPPGKTAKIQALYTTFNIFGNAKKLRAMQLDYIHLQNEFSLSKIMMILSKKDNIPMFYTCHTLWDVMFKTKFKGISPIMIWLTNVLLFKPAARFAHIMTVPTEKVVKIWAKKGKTKNIVALPSAIDLDKYKLYDEDKIKLEELRKQYNIEDNFVLGFVGRISYEKNVEETINYIEKIKDEFPQVKFMIVGNGEALDHLKKITRKKKLEDRIIFVGEIKNDKVKYYYGLFDAFTTPSTFETQGLTYVEAMTAGCPLLVRDDPCLDNFVENEVNGFKYQDLEQFKHYLQLLINEEEVRTNIYNNSRGTLLNFRKDIWARKIYNLYKEAKKVSLDRNYIVDFKEALKIEK